MSVDIRTIDPRAPERSLIAACAEEVLRGGCIAFPTDTFYGLGCCLMDGSAVEMVRRLKGRSNEIGFVSLISDPRAVEALALEIPDAAHHLMRQFWPGPLTLVFQASPLIPEPSRGPEETVALRYPNHELCNKLVEAAGGPLIASSANRTGQPPAKTAAEVAEIFGNQLAMILDGGSTTADHPSTVVDVTSGEPLLLRTGAIDVGEIRKG